MAGILLNRSRQVPAEDTPAFGGIAERFRRAGDLDRAIALCREGLQKFPDQLSARVTLGWSLLDKGKYDDARAELERVLRRAPDNLAAIRGLAELHDRSEGAMPSMDERESWRQEDDDQQAANAALAPAATAATTAEVAEDPFAPISVTLASATEQPSPEILHTADDANQSAQAAAMAAAVEALLGPARVEVEGPAAAAMAASMPASPDPAEAALLDAASLEDAVAGLEIEVTAFDPGGHSPAPEPTLAFSPFDAGQEPAILGPQGEMVSAQTPSVFEVEAASEPMLSQWDTAAPATGDTLLGPEVEFSDAADLVAALHVADAPDAGDTSSLVLEMPSTDEGALDAALTAFEEPPAVLAPPPALADQVDEADQPIEVVALSESDMDAVAIVPPVEAVTMAAAVEPSLEVTPPDVTPAVITPLEDAFELSGMGAVRATVSPRAYDVSAPPPEDSATWAPEEPATLLDDEHVAEVGRFDLPDVDAMELERVAADEAAAVPSVADQIETVELESKDLFALTSPEVSDVDVVDQSAEAAEAEPYEVGHLLEMVEPEVLPAPEAVVSEPEPIADTVTAAFEGLPEPIDDLPDTEQEPEFVPDLNYALETAEAPPFLESEPEDAASPSPLAALVSAVATEHVSAEIVRMTARAEAQKTSMAALERFLRQVERRRLQLESGSVA